MTTPPTPTTPDRTRAFFTNSAIAACILCPAIALLPPRKFDLYTASLGLAFCVSSSFLIEQRTGHGLLWHIGYRLPASTTWGAAEREKVQRMQAGAAHQHQQKLEAVEMGRTKEWIEKRREAEELWIDDEKKGYTGLIMEQVKDVLFGGGEK